MRLLIEIQTATGLMILMVYMGDRDTISIIFGALMELCRIVIMLITMK